MGDDEELEQQLDTEPERLTDVDGYLIVKRSQHRPRVHLLRPYPQCGVDESSAIAVSGSRELLTAKLVELGYRRGGVACRRCFPYRADEDREEPELTYAPEED